MSASKLDAVYRSILITKFFTKGWGKPDNLKRIFEFRKVISNRDECYKLIPADYPVTITKEEKKSDYHLLEGHFISPLVPLLPGVVPECAKLAHFQVVMPVNWPDSNYKPMCIHLAGTGDHYFWRRRNLMAKPLLKEGIGAIILENPFYGMRKPDDQVRSSLHNVSDIFVMGGCLILETLVLLHWCRRNGLGPLGVTGLSMGGHMASLAATNWPQPLVLVPCLSWSTASAVFTRGVMADSINWELLENQFFSDGVYKEQLSKMVAVVDEAFLAGRKFAQQFSKHKKDPETINQLTLPVILNTINNGVKTFDITNPNSLMQCQGLSPDAVKNYSNTSSLNLASKIHDDKVVSVESLKTDHKISDNLYKKITSDKKFTLEQSEINELNELAMQTVTDQMKSGKGGNIQQTINVDNSKSDSMENVQSSNSNNIKALTLTNLPSVSVKVPSKELICSTESKALVKVSDVEKIVKNRSDTTWGVTMRFLSGFPFISKTPKDEKQRYREALQFMRGVMDECTHLGNFSIPYDTSLIIAVCAKNDAYVPRGDTGNLEELWPGAEVKYIDAGHVSAYVLHQKLFRSCIVEAFERSKKKMKDEPFKHQ